MEEELYQYYISIHTYSNIYYYLLLIDHNSVDMCVFTHYHEPKCGKRILELLKSVIPADEYKSAIVYSCRATNIKIIKILEGGIYKDE